MAMPDTIRADNIVPISVFADIEEIVAEFRNGKIVIMVDDENRENEGDLIRYRNDESSASFIE